MLILSSSPSVKIIEVIDSYLINWLGLGSYNKEKRVLYNELPKLCQQMIKKKSHNCPKRMWTSRKLKENVCFWIKSSIAMIGTQ